MRCGAHCRPRARRRRVKLAWRRTLAQLLPPRCDSANPAPCADDPRDSLRLRRATTGGPRQIDSFLGVLVLVQDYKVYGYVTNTGVRFVLVLDDKDNKDGRCENACARAAQRPSSDVLALLAKHVLPHTAGSSLDGSSAGAHSAVLSCHSAC